jgi:two-component system response regulator LytT
MSLSTVIVDDEQLARDELAFLLKNAGDVNVVAQGKNGLEAVSLIREHNPDLVFLDVQMPGLDGFGVIKKLLDKKVPLPKIVFATAFDQYAVKAFEVNAVDYLLKPFDKKRVVQSVQKARAQQDAGGSPADKIETLVRMLESQKPQPAKLLLKAVGRMFLVDQKDVCYASIEDGIITVVTTGAAGMEGQSNCRTLEELLGSLDPNLFWRAHRSYLVNINRIREVIPWFKSSYQLRMDDKKQTEVPVSRAQTRRLREFARRFANSDSLPVFRPIRAPGLVITRPEVPVARRSSGPGEDQAASASIAVRLRITRVAPSMRINCFFLSSLKSRVTVSRDAPILWAISSWVMAPTRRTSAVTGKCGGVQESSSFASFPAEERASTRSCTSRNAV